MGAGIVFLLLAAAGFAIDRAVLNATPAPVRPAMTAEQIEDWYDAEVLEAFSNNVNISVVGDDDEEDEEEAQLSPAFESWAAEQTQHIMANLTEKQRDTFVRTGRLPSDFSYTRQSPPCLLEAA